MRFEAEFNSGRTGARPLVEGLEGRVLMAGDPVLAWNDVLLDAVRVDRTAPPLAARNMAMVQVAVYDAVNAITRTHHKYLTRPDLKGETSADAAVASAAHQVLSSVFPAQAATFDAKLTESLADVPDGKPEDRGVSLGRKVGNAVVKARRGDRADRTVAYTSADQPGDWQPTPPAFRADPLLPQWPKVKPFAIKRAAAFRPAGPPALNSAAYTNAFNEVKSLGDVNSTARTADQTQIALFWADGAGTATPPGHWNEIAQDVAAQRGNTVADNARMFAQLNVALADAGIACWDAKYEFDLWRPVTGIRAADTDGNAATRADADWTPLIATPPFPSYTSGHSTFSSAAAAVLARFYGTDAIAFTTVGEDTPGDPVRSFSGFSAAAAEAGQSRIYGGIHWQFDNTDAQVAGAAIGNDVADLVALPKGRA